MTRVFGLVGLFIVCAAASPAQSTLRSVEENGPRSKRINIVFLSEGYTSAELPSFAGHVSTAINYMFSREPWQQYRSYCNVYRIEVASNESGTDNGIAGGTRDTYFNSGFYNSSVPQLLYLNGTGQSRAYTLLNQHVPEYDIPIVIVNDSKYGGSGGSISVASIHSLSAMIVEHEVGHSFAGLGDEYDYDYPGYSPAERPNVTAQTSPNLIKWNLWIDAGTPLPTPETTAYDAIVGLFEGAMYRTSGWYRPHNNSVMRNLGRPVGHVNREQFVLSYYSQVSPIDSYTPAQTSRTVNTFEQLTFTATTKQPIGSVLTTNWYIDDQLQDGGDNSFSVSSDVLGNGQRKVKVVVRDPTIFVRNDPLQRLQESIVWTFSLSNQLPPTLPAWREAFGGDTENLSGDGLTNLLKYALGIDPTKIATAAERPTATLTAGVESYLTLSVPRRTRRADIDYIAEVSGDLVNWLSGVGHTVTIEDREDLLVVRDATPLRTAERRFMRLRVREKQ